MSDLRCEYCNWLNKEVQDNFTCSNCGKENIKIEEVIEEEVEQVKELKKKKYN